jgi:hypothetical protein
VHYSVSLSSKLATAALCAFAVAACGGKPDSATSDTVSATTDSSGAAPSTNAPASVRGTVASISSTNIVIKTDTGNATVKLATPFTVYSRSPAKLTDVKDNTFIGVTTVKQPDGTERATEIHIFPEELRGMGEGSRMMTQSSGSSASRMTNGAVSNSRMTNGSASPSRMSNGSVSNANDSTLVVQYAGGSTTVVVPRNVSVSELKATSKTLKMGDRVVVLVTKGPDGSLSSERVLLSQ